MKAYYEKELEQNPIYILGKAYRFSIMETEDDVLIRHLDNAARNKIGGIIKITAEEYVKKKENPLPVSSRPHQREEVRQKIVPQPRFSNRSLRESAADRGKIDPTPAQAATSAPADLSQFVPVASKGVLS